jgi:hypothetical protein
MYARTRRQGVKNYLESTNCSHTGFLLAIFTLLEESIEHLLDFTVESESSFD